MSKVNRAALVVAAKSCWLFAGWWGYACLGCSSSDSSSPVGGSRSADAGGHAVQSSQVGVVPSGSGSTAGATGARESLGSGNGGTPILGSSVAAGGTGALTSDRGESTNPGRGTAGGQGITGGNRGSGGERIALGGSSTDRTTVSLGGRSSAGGPAIAVGSSNIGGSQTLDTSRVIAGRTATGGTKAIGGASASAGVPSRAGAPATGGATGASSVASSCVIPAYDAANPPKALSLSGNLGTHDPVAILVDGIYYLYATGNGIGAKTSSNLTNWTGTPDVFSKIPSWVSTKITAGAVTNIWAPDISYFGGQYHLYYAVSTFGDNQSCIGHAIRASLSTGSWADQGAVICSNVGTKDDWNAIDPNVILDEAGTPWMAFGSFWSGIKLVRLDATGNRDGNDLLAIANSKAIEAPYIIRQCGYYYLFVSFGSCCGSPWDYSIRVGRSKSVEGPYVDKAGVKLTNGGGTLVVEGNSTWTAPGHNAILVTANGAYNLYHALDAKHENPVLRVSQLAMDADGWPVSGGP